MVLPAVFGQDSLRMSGPLIREAYEPPAGHCDFEDAVVTVESIKKVRFDPCFPGLDCAGRVSPRRQLMRAVRRTLKVRDCGRLRRTSKVRFDPCFLSSDVQIQYLCDHFFWIGQALLGKLSIQTGVSRPEPFIANLTFKSQSKLDIEITAGLGIRF